MNKNKNFKKMLLIVVFVVFFIVGCISEGYINEYKEQYAEAKDLLKKESYEEAIDKFKSLEKYKLSKIDEKEINMLLDKANEKLELKKYYIKAEKLLYRGEYLEALKYYFKNNDEKTKYYKLSQERIMDTFKLYLVDKINGNKEEVIDELQNLISEVENNNDKNLNLYKDDLDTIRNTIEKITEDGLDSIKPSKILDEDDFYVVKSELNMKEIRNKETELRQIVKIDGEFSPYEDYYLYKISGNVAGKYELVINFRGHTEVIEGDLSKVQNILQMYRLPEKPQYGDIILINMKIKINGKEVYENIAKEYKVINKN